MLPLLKEDKNVQPFKESETDAFNPRARPPNLHSELQGIEKMTLPGNKLTATGHMSPEGQSLICFLFE